MNKSLFDKETIKQGDIILMKIDLTTNMTFEIKYKKKNDKINLLNNENY